MALQKTVTYRGLTVTDAYHRIVITSLSGAEKGGRIDVYADAESADSIQNRLYIEHRFIIPSDQWETYKLTTAGLEEIGRTARKGMYEYIAATYSKETTEPVPPETVGEPILYYADATSV